MNFIIIINFFQYCISMPIIYHIISRYTALYISNALYCLSIIEYLDSIMSLTHLSTAALTGDAVGGEATVEAMSVQDKSGLCRLRGRLQGAQVEQVNIAGELCC